MKTQRDPPAADIQKVRLTLAAKRKRQRRWQGYRHALLGCAAWLAAALGWMVLDALEPLTASARAAVAIAMLLIAAAMVIVSRERLARQARDTQREILAAAARAEQSLGLAGNPLINAASLDPASPLAGRAAQAGVRILKQHPGDDLTREQHGLRLAARWLWLVMVAWAVVTVIFPSLIGGGLIRFACPWADEPWFSLTQIHVAIQPASIAKGADADVLATLTGQTQPGATLVTLDARGRETGHWPMRPATGDRFMRKLLAVRKPLRFEIRSGGARSRIHTLTPHAPKPSAHHTGHTKAGHPQSQPSAGHHAATQSSAHTQPDQSNLGRAIDQLRAKAKAIARQAQRVDRLKGAPRQSARDDLAAAIQDFRSSAKAFQNAAGHEPPGQASVRSIIANRVAILKLVRQKDLSRPGSHPGWSAHVGRAAEDDARALAGLERVIGSPTVHKNAGQGATAGSGVYHQHMRGGTATSGSSAAVIDQAPPAYRKLLRDYFQRLARDADQRKSQ